MLMYFLNYPEIMPAVVAVLSVLIMSVFYSYSFKGGVSSVYYYTSRNVIVVLSLISVFFILFLAFYFWPFDAVASLYESGVQPNWAVNALKLRVDQISLFFRAFMTVFFSLFVVFFFFDSKRRPGLPVEYLVIAWCFFFFSYVLMSANDFLMMFLSLDAQAVCVFFLMLFESVSRKSTESVWSYFILNGFASSMMLFGIALMFFSCGSISFYDVFSIMTSSNSVTDWSMHVVGFWVVLAGFSIKIGVAPFHFWLPSVLEGTREMTLIFVLILSKMSQFGIFFFLFFHCQNVSSVLCLVLGLCSVLFSGFQSIFEKSVNRHLSYFSIYSSGVVFLFLSTKALAGFSFSMYYLVLSNLFLFMYLILLCSSRDISGASVLKSFFDFLSVFKNSRLMSAVLVFIFVSLLGLPPLVGFFPKLWLLQSLSSMFSMMFIAVLLGSTMLLIFPFLVIMKEMFFLYKDSFGWQQDRFMNIRPGQLAVILILVFMSMMLLADFSAFFVYGM